MEELHVGDIVEVTFNMTDYLLGVITRIDSQENGRYWILYPGGDCGYIDGWKTIKTGRSINIKRTLDNIHN